MRTPAMSTPIPRKKLNCFKIVHSLFTIFLLLVSLYLLSYFFRKDCELAHICGTTYYYMSILNEAENSDFSLQRVADYMVYAYAMRKPHQSKNALHQILLDRNEYFAMLAITQRMAKVSGEDFGSNFDAWVERFASEDSKYAYKDAKEFRQKSGEKVNPLEQPRF